MGLLIVAGLGASADPASAQVYLRGQNDAMAGEVAAVGAEGVAVRTGDRTRIVSWDRVREVRGDQGAKASAFASVSEQLWRARTRLERGDFAAAEPLLDSLVDRARSGPGPTAAVVFEGLLRCRVRRGAQIPAVWAWLDWTGARAGGGDWIGGKVDGARVIDGESGLVPSLPPVFLRDAALDAGAVSEEWGRLVATGGRGSSRAELAGLYLAAIRFEAGMPLDAMPGAPESSGARLVWEIVRARAGDEGERREARDALLKRLEAKDLEPWMECWCRVGVGRSLVREADAESRRRGVVQLLHAPARFVRVSPAVASIALAEAAMTMHELGDEAGAAALKAELMDRFPRTPASAWSRLREIRGAEPAGASGGTPAKAGEGEKPSPVEPAEKPLNRRGR